MGVIKQFKNQPFKFSSIQGKFRLLNCQNTILNILFIPKTVFILLILLPFSSIAQSVNGSWYGKAEIILEGNHNNYLTELILKQRGSDVEGIMGYYFKNQYQSYFIRGKYNAKTRLLYIESVPIVYFRSNEAKPTVNCAMDFEATLTVSKIKSNLKGFFLRQDKYKYTCPDLNLLFTKDEKENTDSVLKEAVAVQRNWKPSAEEVVVTPQVIEEKKADPPPPEMEKFEERKTYLVNDIFVDSDSLRISLYDNGDIDGDTISVFYNKLPIVQHQLLSAQGTNFYLLLDPKTRVHEISMFAENLGSIPPNTALMIIHDGTTRYEIFLTSSYTLNGTVRIRRK
jgi:hypothetical protein